MTDPTVALLGTGKMGAGMARNIAAAGLELLVWNRTRAKAEPLADVATIADSPAAAVAGADIVLTMLYDADSVADTMREAAGGWPEGAVWVQCSTVGVSGAGRLGELAAELGLGYVDAPVLGTKKPAEDGTLLVLASGAEEHSRLVAPVLDAIGSRTMWLGEAGAASRLKLACNAWVATVVQGVAESLTMTEALGLDPALFLDAIAGGPLDSPYLQMKGSTMLEGDFTPAFTAAGVVKDVDLMLEATSATGFDPRLLPAIRQQFARVVEAGLGDRDMSVTYEALRPS